MKLTVYDYKGLALDEWQAADVVGYVDDDGCLYVLPERCIGARLFPWSRSRCDLKAVCATYVSGTWSRYRRTI